jgi:hypothetical protein
MNVREATRRYEHWLGEHVDIVKPDLRRKHELMGADLFPFFRATFYRWMQLWPEACRALARAPTVLAIGDLHVENFGTWRDAEGRLVWGVNDFDEAFVLPWTLDLVRLATSAHIAAESQHLSLVRKDACNAILRGYQKAIASGGRPFVLAEDHAWLRKIALGKLRDPVAFWRKLGALPPYKGRIPREVESALVRALPERGLAYRIAHRVAGLGSLGRHRFVVVADFRGGRVAREAKSVAPSACCLAMDVPGRTKVRYAEIIDAAVRVPDPYVSVSARWIVRRLAPDCARVELADLPAERDEAELLYSMGFETGNIHLGTRGAANKIMRSLDKLPADWLHKAVKRMAKLVFDDWTAWRKVQ